MHSQTIKNYFFLPKLKRFLRMIISSFIKTSYRSWISLWMPQTSRWYCLSSLSTSSDKLRTVTEKVKQHQRSFHGYINIVRNKKDTRVFLQDIQLKFWETMWYRYAVLYAQQQLPAWSQLNVENQPHPDRASLLCCGNSLTLNILMITELKDPQ